MRNKISSLLIGTGLLLIAAALFITGYNIYESNRAEKTVRTAVAAIRQELPETKAFDDPDPESAAAEKVSFADYILNPRMDMPEKEIDGDLYIGVLSVPSCGLELPVMSTWSYPSLKKAPCRYSGTAYLENMVIAAHNYRSHFGALRGLREGDAAAFTDMDGNQFFYVLESIEVLQPTAIEEMKASDAVLTLFTCTAGGQSRMTYRFEACAAD